MCGWLTQPRNDRDSDDYPDTASLGRPDFHALAGILIGSPVARSAIAFTSPSATILREALRFLWSYTIAECAFIQGLSYKMADQTWKKPFSIPEATDRGENTDRGVLIDPICRGLGRALIR